MIMSQEAYQAEKDLNSYQAKTGRGGKNISDTGSYPSLLSYQSHADIFFYQPKKPASMQVQRISSQAHR